MDMPRTTRRGFSLVEILVVIAVIVILLGLGAVGMNQARKAQDRNRTVQILRNLGQAQSELATLLEQRGDSSTYNNMATFLQKANSIDSSAKLLNVIPNTNVVRDSSTSLITGVNDGWDQPIQYNDGKGTNGQPTHSTPYFFSGGPDKNTATTADNVYSYDLD